MSVAKSLPHDAAKLHVTGAARYVDDIPTPRGTLHLAFGLSPKACGKITALEEKAVKLEIAPKVVIKVLKSQVAGVEGEAVEAVANANAR